MPKNTEQWETLTSDGDPLASSALRFELRRVVHAASPTTARPLALRFTQDRAIPRRSPGRYDPVRQLGVSEDGTALIDDGKKWGKKGQSDGDEGPEEFYGWEEG